MILNIKEEYDKSFTQDCYTLAGHMLALKSTHLFIAANRWDRVNIELTDTIPVSALSYIPMAANEIFVKLPETITDTTVNQLAQLYPDMAGLIRRKYLQGANLAEVLKDWLVQ